MKHLRQYIRQILKEDLDLDIDPGDIILTGKFKNKRRQVKDIGEDENGQPTINGKSILKFRIEKDLPFNKKSAATKQYIQQLADTISPPPSASQLTEELYTIQDQTESPHNPEHMQQAMDSNFQQLFVDLLKNNGIQENAGNLKNITNKYISITKDLKNYFNIERPLTLAQSLDIPLVSKQQTMSSAQSYSYPSGHTIQAFSLAHILSDRYPQLHTDLFNLANNIAQSRVDTAVHFPSDISAGITIARSIHSSIQYT
jgi:hypothetical protein